MNKKVNRIHAMDFLRSIAMYLGVILHAAIVYQIQPRAGWPVDKTDFILFDVYYEFVHSFRMQLFYLIAGFFANLLLNKIGDQAFVSHRLKRIVLPFSVSLLLVAPVSSLAFNYYYSLDAGLDRLESWRVSFSELISWNGMYHLWFLYYLMMFYATILILRKSFLKLTAKVGFGFGSIFIFVVVLFGITYFMYDVEVEPWTGALPKLNQFLYYGLFFLFGYLLFNNLELIKMYSNNVWYYMAIGLGAGVWVLIVPLESFPLQTVGYVFIKSVQTVFLVFGFLAFFLKYCERDSYIVRYFSDTSYWVYLIHFPLVTILQVVLLDYNIHALLKFSIVITLSTSVSLVTYHYLIRYSLIGEILNGKRYKKN
ncbi:MAG: acyltransferase family protein [Reichenbachiella sp.]